MVVTDYSEISSFHFFLYTDQVVGETEEDVTGQGCELHFHHGNWVTAALSSWTSLKAV